VIAEVIPETYDALGRRVSQPFHRRRGIHPTFPMGRYVSQPLAVRCENVGDIRRFLMSCETVTDEEQFGKRDYWLPPEEFERCKKGDCDDFALWTWRQLLSMGYDARIVFGRAGRYGTGHAWVMYFEKGKCFLVEPTFRVVGETMPRLSTIKYKPSFSVAWDGKSLSYYAHKDRSFQPPWAQLPRLVCEWLCFWGWFWLRVIPRFHRIVANAWRKWRRKHEPGPQ